MALNFQFDARMRQRADWNLWSGLTGMYSYAKALEKCY